MVFTDYEAFRAAVQQLIEGDDTIGTFNANTMDLLIGLGESRVYNGDAITAGLRASTMLKDYTAPVVSNAAALPADLLELKELTFASQCPVEIVPLDKIRKLEARPSLGYETQYAAQDGDSLRFWPLAPTPVAGRYYARPEALQTVTWADATTFARYPELFIFASLIESAPFLGMDARMQVWDAKYRSAADGANHAERMRVYGASPLRQRVR